MINSVAVLLGVPILAFALCAATVPLAGSIGTRLGITAKRSHRPGSADQVPVFGGAAIVAAVVGALAAFGQLSGWELLGAGTLWAVGAIDDAIELRPLQKLAAQAVVALFLVLKLPQLPLTPWAPVNATLEIIWLLATTNAFNLVDGLDGLAAGIGIVAALALGVTGALHANAALAAGGLAVGGALAGFLAYNYYPASIFMGDAGALPIGLLLGVFALQGAGLAANSRLTKYIFPVLVMLVPLLDTAIVTVTRLATGASISRHGLDHSHHRLLSLGLSERTSAFVCWSVAALSATCAVVMSLLPHAHVLMALPLIALAAAVIALFMMDLTFDSTAPGVAYGESLGLARFILNLGYKRRIAEAVVDLALISAAYFGALMLRLEFTINDDLASAMVRSLPWVILLTYAAFVVVGIYRGIWRYTALSDGIRFAYGAVLAGLLVAAGSLVVAMVLSGSVVVLYVVILFNLLLVTRLSFQALRHGIHQLAAPGKRVLVVGAGQVGTAAASYLASERSQELRLVGFIDDDGFKLGKLLLGQRVLGSVDDLEQIFNVAPFEELLVAEELSEERLTQLRGFAEEHGLAVRQFLIQVSDLSAPPSAPMRRAGARSTG
jgi:UDP-GlcNAc:undecaprenyl-phosphate GlcNAc-1-phosphate transferase